MTNIRSSSAVPVLRGLPGGRLATAGKSPAAIPRLQLFGKSWMTP
jgi:hypothetical protein